MAAKLRRAGILAASVLLAGSLVAGLPGLTAQAAPALVPAVVPGETVLYDSFATATLNSAVWSQRAQKQLFFNSKVADRSCGMPWGNASVSGGSFRATVSKASGADAAYIVSQAKAAQKAAGKKVVGCPSGTFKNAMVSTQDSGLTAKYGTLTARVKFPQGQGFHGSVWLQSSGSGLGAEIDLIESFGYGKGVGNYVQVPSGSKLVKFGGYVKATKTVKTKSKAWWNKAHNYSVTWSLQGNGKTKFVFSVDGTVTRTVYAAVPERDYFVVMSNLSSDWELKYLKKPSKGAPGVKKTKLPASMIVEWVELKKTA
jgi:hypothetical protein